MHRARRRALGLTIGALLLTLGSPAHAYTLKAAPTGAAVRWHRPTVALEVMDTSAGGLPRSELVSALRRAAAPWNALPNTPSLEVVEGRSSSRGADGVNGVYLLDRWPFPDERLAVTVSTYVEGTGELIDTDILINGEMELAVLDPEGTDDDRYDLVLVLTHELGHVLGLDESEVVEATMWHRIGRGETTRRELATDDVDGALALYPTAHFAREEAGGGCSVVASGVPGRMPLALVVALVAFFVRRLSGDRGRARRAGCA